MGKPVKQILALSLIGLLSLTACSAKEDQPAQKILREAPAKEITAFVIGKDQPDLTINKSGTISSSLTANISPEITGRVIDIQAKIGDKVKKNSTLITLGNSLSTNLLELHLQTARRSELLARDTQNITRFSTEQTLDAAEIGAEIAFEAYQNALISEDNTKEIFQQQHKNARIEIDNAEEGLESAKDNFYSARDQLEELEDEIDEIQDQILDLKDLPVTPETLATIAELEQLEDELDIAAETLENQVDNASTAVNIAENRVEQAEIGLDQLEANFDAQFDQLNFAAVSAQKQYEAALNQLEAAQAAAELQEIGSENQVVQAQAALDSAALTAEQKILKSPIEGTIKSIDTEEGNLISPGQVVVTIENNNSLSVKTSLNSSEVEFIKVGESAVIKSKKENVLAKVISISPSLNDSTQKFDVELEFISNKIPAGSLVNVEFKLTTDKIFIPLNAVFLQNDGKYVKVINTKNKVEYRKIEQGEIIGSFVEIKKGLKKGEKVITSSDIFLNKEDNVKVVEENP